jgi:hypothetical protein
MITVTSKDGSVYPLDDTGFRMAPQEPFSYVPRPNPPVKRMLDYVHVDDIVTRSETGLRGITYITINQDAADARIVDDIRRNIATGGSR